MPSFIFTVLSSVYNANTDFANPIISGDSFTGLTSTITGTAGTTTTITYTWTSFTSEWDFSNDGLKISGNAGFNLNVASLNITQWGGIPLSRCPIGTGIFKNFLGKITAIDSPTILTNTNFNHLFSGSIISTERFGNLNNWNMINVVSMNSMFQGCTSFNQDISSWNFSNTTDMSSMFQGCTSFNQDISSWNTINVVGMNSMFQGCTSFNRDIGSWNTSHVAYRGSMFKNCIAFNQSSIGLWDYSYENNIIDMITNTGYTPTQYSQFLINLSANATLPTNDPESEMYISLGTTGLTRYNNTLTNNAYNTLTNPNGLNMTIVDTQISQSFIFTVSTTDYNNNLTAFNPIINASNSFVNLSNNVTSSGGTTTITYSWMGYTDTGSNDGLQISGNADFGLNVASLNITNFGSIPLTRESSNAFAYFTGQNSASDNPVILTNTNLTSLFYGSTVASANFGNIGSWSMTNVTNMSNMFYGCTGFNQDISSWDTSNVTDMNNMFAYCSVFAPSTLPFNTSNVTDMSSMFNSCSAFAPTTLPFNTSNVTNMSNMFWYCSVFAPSTLSFNTSNVTDMNNMFNSCELFAPTTLPWDTSNVTDMNNMFCGCVLFAPSTLPWDTSKVTDMNSMFYSCYVFAPVDISWNTTNVTNMNNMFTECTLFSPSTLSLDTSNVTNMNNMFIDCPSFNQLAIGSWNFTHATTILNMITGTGYSIRQYSQLLINLSTNATLPTGLSLGTNGLTRNNNTLTTTAYTTLTNPNGINMTIVDTMTHSFIFTISTTDYNNHLSTYNPIINTSNSFVDLSNNVVSSSGTTTVYYYWTSYTDTGSNDGLKISGNSAFGLNVASLNITNFGSIPLTRASTSAFAHFSGKITADDSPTILTNTNFTSLFSGSTVASANFGNIGSWSMTNVTNMSSMFYNCTNFNQPIGSWTPTNVTNMGYMFNGCMSFAPSTLPWTTTNVTNMGYMFCGCESFAPSTLPWDTSNVTDMNNMFNTCGSFSPSTLPWDTSNVTDMHNMFNYCVSFAPSTLPWTTSNVTDMHNMFNYCGLFAPSTLLWDTSKVTDMNTMFNACSSFAPSTLPWTTSNVTDMNNMFNCCSSFAPSTLPWDTSKVTNMSAMFNNCGSFAPVTLPFNTSNVTNMSSMFYSCWLFAPSTLSWDTSKVIDMNNMFNDCSLFAPVTLPFNTSNVTNMSSMFYNCSTFKNAIIGSWNFTSATNISEIIYNAGFDILQYGQFLINLSVNSTLNPNLTLFSSAFSIRINNTLTNAAYTKLTATVANGGNNMSIPDYVVNAFIMTVSTADATTYTPDTIGRNPIVNTDSSFTGYGYQSIVNNNGTTTIICYWTSFIDNGTTSDGLKISGNCNFSLNVASLNITVFGGVHLTRESSNAFANFTGQISATDSPTILTNTILSSLFYGSTVASANFGNIGEWAMTNVTNMSSMFYGCTSFNQPIGSWTTTNVTNMGGMFQGCSAFNQDIHSWSTANVTTMGNMFQGCTVFNQPIGSWSTANVTNMTSMFQTCSAFNQTAIGSWNFTKIITFTDFITNTGYNATQYGQFLVVLSANATLPTGLILGADGLTRYNTIIELNSYTQLTKSVETGGKNLSITDSITPLYNFIYTVSTTDYNNNLSKINPIINTDQSFINLIYEPITNGDGTTTVYWYWSAFTDLTGTTNDGLRIVGNSGFTLNVASLDINNFNGIQLSRSSSSAFANFSGQISATDSPTILSNTDFSNLFSASEISSASFGNIGSWDVSGVTNMTGMFVNAHNFNQNISSWNTANVTSMFGMFYSAYAFNQNIGSWNTANVNDMSNMFFNAQNFNQNIGSWTTTNVTTMASMFNYANHFNCNLNSWDTSNITNMSSMFSGCSGFNGDIHSWDTSKVTTMFTMFSGCNVFNQNLSSWDTSKVTTMDSMFGGCSLFNSNIGSWDVSGVNIMTSMFNGCSVFNNDLNSWHTTNVTNMDSMFRSCTNFNGNISSWNTTNVTNMSLLFKDCTSFNQGISSWNVANVTNFSSMLQGCASFNQVAIGSWDFTHATTILNMITGTGYSVSQYSLFLILLGANTTLSTGLSLGTDGLTRYDNTFTTSAYTTLTDPDGKNLTIVDTSMSTQSFIFTVSTTDYNNNLTTFNPIIDASNSFVNLSNYVVSSSGTTTVYYYWTGYMDTGSNDGLKISGNSGFGLNVTSLNITNFGSIPLTRASSSGFANFLGRISATDSPTILTNTNFTSLFSGSTVASANFGNIGSWPMANVTNTTYMFYGCTNFNQPIGYWITTNITNMSSMFQDCAYFNQNLNNWNVSHVTNMSSMFNGCTMFNV